jgi:circadian clock protein KaiB
MEKGGKRVKKKPDKVASNGSDRYKLRLFITGISPRSSRAIVNIRKVCEEHLKGRYELEIIDITENPALAKSEQILAAPTLVKKLPLPLRRFIGDMSETDRLLFGLDIGKS